MMIERNPRDLNLEQTKQQTSGLQEIKEAIPSRFIFSDAGGSLMEDLERIERKGYWRSEIAEKVLEVATRFNMISTQRLIENCLDLLENSEFDFGKYSDLFIQAHRNFGLRAGGYFSLSYGKMLKLGVDPQNYFDWVDYAVDEGGKILAAYYAYMLPFVIEAGGDPSEFRVNACEIRNKGGLKMARPFILNVPIALQAGLSTVEFGDLSIRAVEELEKKTAYWVIRNMASLARLGYSPYQFLGDTKELFKEKGEKAARWYASGFTSLITLKREIMERISHIERYTGEAQDEKEKRERLEILAYWQKTNTSFDPLGFREGYLKLLALVGQNAATFYSLSTKEWGNWELEEAIKNFKLIPDRSIDLYNKVSKKVFSSTMWFALKITSHPQTVVGLLDDVGKVFEKNGESITLTAIKYTYGLRRRGWYFSALEHPDLIFGENGEVVSLRVKGGREVVVLAGNEPYGEAEWEDILRYPKFFGQGDVEDEEGNKTLPNFDDLPE